jgi:RHS repeat-associated protein
MTKAIVAARGAGKGDFASLRFVRNGLALLTALSLSLTTVAPAFAVTSSPASPALAGLPAAPAPGGESSGEGAANVSPYDVNNANSGLMSLMSGGDEPKSAKFEPPDTPYNGAFTRSLPVEVPPFFEITPRIKLTYNSGDNRQHARDGFSILGVGWTMSGGGLIERRSSRGGLPRFDATDVFELDGNTLMDCVVEGVTRQTPSCSAGGTHTGRYETYERIKRNTTLNSWEITARDGTVSTYKALASFAAAGTEDARLRNDYRWLLQSVTDTDGNTVTYSYDCAALPTCYVSTISYGTSSIQFYWETRTDTFTYATGISLGNATKRLKTIAVRAGASLIRAYAVGYTISLDTKRSLLSSFKQHGSDATVNATTGVISGGTSLPADNFTYWDMTSRRMGTMISDLVTANTAPEGTPSTTATEVDPSPGARADFNGDGLLDNYSIDKVGPCEIKLTFGSRSATPATVVVTDPGNLLPFASCSDITGSFTGDFNGDGKADLNLTGKIGNNVPKAPFKAQLNAAGYGHDDLFAATVYLNGTTIAATSVSGTYDGLVSSFEDAVVADFTGDGRDDFIYVGRIFVSDGIAFSKQNWGDLGSDEHKRIGDFNADGSADLLASNSNGSNKRLLISTGAGFDLVSLSGVVAAYASVLSDWNADGATDLAGPATGSSLSRYESTGSSMVGTILPLNSASNTVGAVDFNGDGQGDIVKQQSNNIEIRLRDMTWNSTFQSTVQKFSGNDSNYDGKADISADSESQGRTIYEDSVFPDLLKRHTLPSGGTVDVEFLPSSYWPNGYLPMVVHAVSKVTTSDGRGNSSKTKYAYEGGVYDPFERRFLGFAKVTAELACETGEATCPWVHAWYRQEAVAAGSLSKLEVYAPNGQIQKKLENGYVVNQASAPFTAFKTSEQVTDYLVGGNAVARKEWTYDGYANLLEEKDLGVTGSTADDLITATSYELNLTNYIVDKPVRVTATAAGGALLRDTQIFYDGAAAAGVEPSKGHATTTKRWLASESRWLATTAEFDSYGNQTAAIDPLGNRTGRIYDVTQQYVIEERNPLWFDGDLRQKTLTAWHALCGAPSSATDRNGLVTSYQYDALCRETRIDYPSADYLTTAYLNIGTPTTQYVETTRSPADGVNPIWSRTYLDGLGRTYKTTGIGATAAAQPVVTETKYAKRGPANQQSLPYFQGGTAQWTTTRFDVLGRPVLVTLPDTKTIATAYEAPQSIPGTLTVKTTDPLSRISRVTTDARGNPLARIGYLGATAVASSYSYDPLGNLVSVVDPMGNAWSNSYDSLGRRTVSTDPDLGTWSYGYDDAGRLLTQIDAKSQQTAFSYDRLGRVLTKTSGVGLPNAEVVANTYDETRSGFFNVGQLTTAANDNAVATSDYDAGGRLTKEQRTVDSVAYTTSTAYDPGGRITAKSFPNSSSSGAYGYNAAGQLITLAGAITGTTYNAEGAVLTIGYANGVTTTYTYSPSRSWLNSVSTVKGATTIQSYTYTRDFAGRITGIDGDRANEDWSYGYDNLDRLLSASNTGTPALSRSFTYDLGGKLTSNSSVGTYAYPTQGSSAFQPHAVSTAGTWSFSYDLNGNQTSRLTSGVADRTIAYDNDNRPTSVTLGSATVTYLYGPDGERLKKQTTSGTTLYLGADTEIDPAGGHTNYLGTDVKQVGGVINVLHRDHLTSVRRVTDATGTLTRASVYQPYGVQTETVLAPLSPAEPKGWIGERTDPETGLTYLHARYYDASLGRFLSPDWWDVSDPAVGTDRYGYSMGDPVNKADPNGHMTFAELINPFWEFATGTASSSSRGGPVAAGSYLLWKIVEPSPAGGDSEREFERQVNSELARRAFAAAVAEGKDEEEKAVQPTGNEGIVVSPPKYGSAPNNGKAPPHGNPDHDAAITAEIDRVRGLGAENIRKNQPQVDINGVQVGSNRPDLQYDLDGLHHNVEFDHRSSRSKAHGDTIRGNDASSTCVLNMLGGC